MSMRDELQKSVSLGGLKQVLELVAGVAKDEAQGIADGGETDDCGGTGDQHEDAVNLREVAQELDELAKRCYT